MNLGNFIWSRSRTAGSAVLLMFVFAWPVFASGSTDYYRHVVFDNSLNADGYFYSNAMSNGRSFIEQLNARLPVETKIFLTPPNALRLQWQSEPGGGWEAEVRVMNFRNRYPEFSGHTLYFWVY